MFDFISLGGLTGLFSPTGTNPAETALDQTRIRKRGSGSKYTLYPMRWWVLTLFSVMAFLNNVLCFTYAPISQKAEEFYNSTEPMAWMVNVYFVSYILLAVPSSRLLAKYGLRTCFLLGCWAQTLGALIRMTAVPLSEYLFQSRDSSFSIAFFGQTITSLGQGFFVNTPPLVSAMWFGKHERTLATTIACNANTLGVAGAYALGTLLVGSKVENVRYAVDIPAVASAIFLTLSLLSFPERPPTPPSAHAEATAKRQGMSNSNPIRDNSNSSNSNYVLQASNPGALIESKSVDHGDVTSHHASHTSPSSGPATKSIRFRDSETVINPASSYSSKRSLGSAVLTDYQRALQDEIEQLKRERRRIRQQIEERKRMVDNQFNPDGVKTTSGSGKRKHRHTPSGAAPVDTADASAPDTTAHDEVSAAAGRLDQRAPLLSATEMRHTLARVRKASSTPYISVNVSLDADSLGHFKPPPSQARPLQEVLHTPKPAQHAKQLRERQPPQVAVPPENEQHEQEITVEEAPAETRSPKQERRKQPELLDLHPELRARFGVAPGPALDPEGRVIGHDEENAEGGSDNEAAIEGAQMEGLVSEDIAQVNEPEAKLEAELEAEEAMSSSDSSDDLSTSDEDTDTDEDTSTSSSRSTISSSDSSTLPAQLLTETAHYHLLHSLTCRHCGPISRKYLKGGAAEGDANSSAVQPVDIAIRSHFISRACACCRSKCPLSQTLPDKVLEVHEADAATPRAALDSRKITPLRVEGSPTHPFSPPSDISSGSSPSDVISPPSSGVRSERFAERVSRTADILFQRILPTISDSHATPAVAAKILTTPTAAAAAAAAASLAIAERRESSGSALDLKRVTVHSGSHERELGSTERALRRLSQVAPPSGETTHTTKHDSAAAVAAVAAAAIDKKAITPHALGVGSPTSDFDVEDMLDRSRHLDPDTLRESVKSLMSITPRPRSGSVHRLTAPAPAPAPETSIEVPVTETTPLLAAPDGEHKAIASVPQQTPSTALPIPLTEQGTLREEFKAYMKLFAIPGFIHCVVTFAVAEASINAFSTFMDYELAHVMTTEQIGWIGCVFIVAGLIGSTIFGIAVDRTRRYKDIVTVVFICSIVSLTAFTIAVQLLTKRPDGSAMLMKLISYSIISAGFFLGPLQPIAIEAAAECTFPTPEEVSTAFLQLVANLASAILVPLCTMLRDPDSGDMSAANYCIILIVLGSGAMFATWPQLLLRSEAEAESMKIVIAQYQAQSLAYLLEEQARRERRRRRNRYRRLAMSGDHLLTDSAAESVRASLQSLLEEHRMRKQRKDPARKSLASSTAGGVSGSDPLM